MEGSSDSPSDSVRRSVEVEMSITDDVIINMIVVTQVLLLVCKDSTTARRILSQQNMALRKSINLRKSKYGNY